MRLFKGVVLLLCFSVFHLSTFAQQETTYIPNLWDNKVLNKIETKIDLLAAAGEKEKLIYIIGMSKTYLGILKDSKSQYLLYEIGLIAENRFSEAVAAHENTSGSTTTLSGENTVLATGTTELSGQNSTLSGSETIETTYLESGIASYYGSKFDGRGTANGDIFNNSELTAAHKTLPFNTRVKVINSKTKSRVIVRINDRGPFTPGRVIDLTQAAFKAINNDSLSAGILSVDVEIVN